MIPIEPQPEPPHFEHMVKQPGKAFLEVKSHPTTEEEWKGHNYWKHVARDLYDAYAGICAYSCTWISPTTGISNVEHFRPKSKYPQDAYNWENYRLACWKMNKNKGIYEDVLDPFTLQDNWFVIDFSSLMVFPGDHLTEHDARLVSKTIKRLKLNEDEDCIEERKKWIGDYVTGEITFAHLKKKAPFLASEIERQGYKEKIHPIWAAYKKLAK